jgi:hypothetical protein
MLQDLIHREVEIITPETTYRGTLMGVEDEELHLQSESQWLVIPLERVIDVRAVD